MISLMKFSFPVFLIALAPVAVFASTRSDTIRMLDTAAVRFEPAPEGIKAQYVAIGLRYRFAFTGSRATFRAGHRAMGLRFEGANERATAEGLDQLRSATSRFIGNDHSKWRTGIPNYGRLGVSDVYPGIDLVYYGNAHRLEYDLTVKPGADPGRVHLRFEGGHPRIDRHGDLISDFIQKRPVAYQIAADGSHIPVQSRYRRNRDGSFGFALGAYDRRRELVIDPVLTFSAYVGGSSANTINGIGHDANGLIYVVGTTASTDLPIVGTPVQTALDVLDGPDSDVFMVQIDPKQPAGSQVIYSTYLGGAGNDSANDMVVGPHGDVYITGTTASSSDFPLANAQQSVFGGGDTDAFFSWIQPSASGFGGLFSSSYYGGSGDDTGNAITVDASSNIYIAGSTTSTNLPLANAAQSALAGFQDAFIAGFAAAQVPTALLYASYFGGSGNDDGNAIARAADGTFWIAGGTFSTDLPIIGFSYQFHYGGAGDAYLAHIDPTQGANGLLYATYLGGNTTDEATRLAIDPNSGNVIVAGFTASANFPVTPDALQAHYGGNTDVFVTILNPADTSPNRADQLVYSTFYGGSGGEAPTGLKEDAAGNLYLTGYTLSPNLPVSAGALQPAWDGNLDAFALKFNPAVATNGNFDYSSYIGSDGQQVAGGIDVDASGNILIAGFTTGLIFGTSGTPKTGNPGNIDGFILGFSPCGLDTNPHSQQFPEAGGSSTVAVTASRGCSWTASSTLSWVTVSPAGGVGNGSVTIVVAPNNTGAARQGTISIAGVSFIVGQDQ
jgi:hypothetical protein